jgi:hypothetical protein
MCGPPRLLVVSESNVRVRGQGPQPAQSSFVVVHWRHLGNPAHAPRTLLKVRSTRELLQLQKADGRTCGRDNGISLNEQHGGAHHVEDFIQRAGEASIRGGGKAPGERLIGCLGGGDFTVREDHELVHVGVPGK